MSVGRHTRGRRAIDAAATRRSARGAWLVALALGALVVRAPAARGAPVQSGDRPQTTTGATGAQKPDELAQLLAEERRECDRLRRRGEVAAADKRLTELLDETPTDAESRTLRALCRLDATKYDEAVEDARRAVADARTATGDAGRALRAACARNLASILALLGRAKEAQAALEESTKDLAPALDASDAWAVGSIAWQLGDRKRARAVLEQGAQTSDAQSWRGLLARGLCQRRLGDLGPASESFIRADRAASGTDAKGESAEGVEPDVLAALGDLYFEADREVEAAQHRSAADLYHEALRLDPTHEGAALGLFRLHRYNWQRKSRSAQDILNEFLSARPDSIEGLIAAASADVDDGQLKSARERLARLEKIAPGRREVRTLRATMHWIEHDTAACEAVVRALLADDPQDSACEREIGRHLCELYRFAEALPWEQRAVERDEHDWEAWTQLGRAQANTGDEKSARETLDRAQTEAGLRQDAWRTNLRLVLKTMSEQYLREQHGELSFMWKPDAADVLRTYLVPFYAAARQELAQRYGYTPGATQIEVFSRHQDFSVRSTGFPGFPALGVCFGPVVTSVSALCEMRGTFSWARTSFHEFTHVIHLGLSHNRCPRWITEGLATWEEVNKNPAWTRNMRRDLLDAYNNGDVIPVRELNRAFRGPRILFGYYQGGLLCQMLISERGFSPIVRLLEAFDRGLDLDQAFGEVYQTTPEELDRDFARFVAHEIDGLRIEPRWNPSRVSALRIGLSRKAPSTSAAANKWASDWCTVAWSAWQTSHKVDAEEALRVIQKVDPQPARALLLRGEMALAAGDRDKAREIWELALVEGGEDFRARMALGTIAHEAGDDAAAEKHFLAAEKDFPGFDEIELSAESELCKLYDATDRRDDAMRARERWLAYNAGALKEEREVAAWHFEQKRNEASLKYFSQANDIDPFRREIHRSWGDALRAVGRHEEALREYRVALMVPVELDADQPAELTDSERAELIALEAASLLELDRHAEALDMARRALELDPDCALGRETLDKLH